MEPTDCEVGDDSTIDSNCAPAMIILTDSSSENLTIDFGFNEPPLGDDGCTPGYWKNHLLAWNYTDHSPETPVGDVWDAANSVVPELAEATLMEALRFTGGEGLSGAARNFLRVATASLLNASHADVGFPLTLQQIIDGGNAALETQDLHEILALKDTLDYLNNAGCPLGRWGTSEQQDIEYARPAGADMRHKVKRGNGVKVNRGAGFLRQN
jgi:hypothetical protein